MALSHKYTLLCDDVRQESTGKLIIIGVYAGVVGVPQIPFIFPTGLTFFQGWESDRVGQVDLKVKIQHLESGQVIIEARAGITVQNPSAPIMLPLRLAPLQFTALGTYNMIVEIEGQKDPVIVDFNVQLAQAILQGQAVPGTSRS